ncbi:MAG: hypothetical protein PHO53_06215 [Actinomycetota bacterium]|nr:hypothetical protein [Actinomycetota bacterium]
MNRRTLEICEGIIVWCAIELLSREQPPVSDKLWRVEQKVYLAAGAKLEQKQENAGV